MNWYAVRAIYHFAMARMWRTVVQSIVAVILLDAVFAVLMQALDI